MIYTTYYVIYTTHYIIIVLCILPILYTREIKENERKANLFIFFKRGYKLKKHQQRKTVRKKKGYFCVLDQVF